MSEQRGHTGEGRLVLDRERDIRRCDGLLEPCVEIEWRLALGQRRSVSLVGQLDQAARLGLPQRRQRGLGRAEGERRAGRCHHPIGQQPRGPCPRRRPRPLARRLWRGAGRARWRRHSRSFQQGRQNRSSKAQRAYRELDSAANRAAGGVTVELPARCESRGARRSRAVSEWDVLWVPSRLAWL